MQIKVNATRARLTAFPIYFGASNSAGGVRPDKGLR